MTDPTRASQERVLRHLAHESDECGHPFSAGVYRECAIEIEAAKPVADAKLKAAFAAGAEYMRGKALAMVWINHPKSHPAVVMPLANEVSAAADGYVERIGGAS